MNSELKKRFITGTLLILIISIMFISKIFYLYVVLITFALSFIEFTSMSSKIFKKKNFSIFLFNILFLFYLSLFLIITFLGINNIHFKIILYVTLLVCIASDIGGITFGKIFKGPKLTIISPNKTISGSLGSFFFSILISIFLLDLLLKTNLSISVFFGFVISLSVQIGDLFFSYLKRKSSIKNTGNILPGHGGVLDRIDGILLGIPVGLIFVFILLF